jgi:predicted DNA-binding protein with PD1-like motif
MTNNQGTSRTIANRFQAGTDFKAALEEMVQKEKIEAGVLLSVVGSLTKAVLRTPSGATKVLSEPLEIVSGTGTVGSAGMHVHISVSDDRGATFGGHLLAGCVVRTTLELVVQDLSSQMIFDRVLDENTGYRELVVRKTEG